MIVPGFRNFPALIINFRMFSKDNSIDILTWSRDPSSCSTLTVSTQRDRYKVSFPVFYHDMQCKHSFLSSDRVRKISPEHPSF